MALKSAAIFPQKPLVHPGHGGNVLKHLLRSGCFLPALADRQSPCGEVLLWKSGDVSFAVIPCCPLEQVPCPFVLKKEVGQLWIRSAPSPDTLHIFDDANVQPQAVPVNKRGFGLHDIGPDIGTRSDRTEIAEIHQVPQFPGGDLFPEVSLPVKKPVEFGKQKAGFPSGTGRCHSLHTGRRLL